jgi:hypothetical protein
MKPTALHPQVLRPQFPSSLCTFLLLIAFALPSYGESHYSGNSGQNENPPLSLQCSNCLNWCTQSLRQNGSSAAYSTCIAGCAEQNQQCQAPERSDIFAIEAPPKSDASISDQAEPTTIAAEPVGVAGPDLLLRPGNPATPPGIEIDPDAIVLKQSAEALKRLRQQQVDFQLKMIAALATDETGTEERQQIAEKLRQTRRALHIERKRSEAADRNLASRGLSFIVEGSR